MISSDKTKICHIEFTSKCNLRCVYCAINQTGYVFHTFSPDKIDGLIQLLLERRVNIVSVNGHGETTIFPGWHRYCDRLIEAGIPLHIISNFAKAFSEEEIDTLTRFRDIEISCDTADPVLFAKIRRNGDLRVIESNLRRLMARAVERGLDAPKISFSVVLTDLTVFGLTGLVQYALDLGVSYFNFCNLIKHAEYGNEFELNHVTTLCRDELLRARAEICKTFALLKDRRIGFDHSRGLIDSIDQKLAEERNVEQPALVCVPDRPGDKSVAVPELRSIKYAGRVKTGQTRNCLDPWHFIMIEASGLFRPCCWHQETGVMDDNHPAGSLFNNAAMKSLRWRLLTGRLDAQCAHCPARGLMNRYKFNLKALIKLFNQKRDLRLLRSFVANLLLTRLRPVPLGLTEGWYDQEQERPGGLSWRWIARSATATLKTGKRKLQIEFSGRQRGDQEGQGLRVLFNGQEVDYFLISDLTFSRSLLVDRRIYPSRNKVDLLEIRVNKTFRPADIDPASEDRRELGVQIGMLRVGSIGLMGGVWE